MSQDKPSFLDIIRANRKIIYVLLGVPILGMVIAFGLILYKQPNNMVIILAVIFFLIIQYGVTIVYLNAKLNKMSEKDDGNK